MARIGIDESGKKYALVPNKTARITSFREEKYSPVVQRLEKLTVREEFYTSYQKFNSESVIEKATLLDRVT